MGGSGGGDVTRRPAVVLPPDRRALGWSGQARGARQGARRRARPHRARRADQPPRPRSDRVARDQAVDRTVGTRARHPRPARARPAHDRSRDGQGGRDRRRARVCARGRRRIECLRDVSGREGGAPRTRGRGRGDAPDPRSSRAGLVAPGCARQIDEAQGPSPACGRDRRWGTRAVGCPGQRTRARCRHQPARQPGHRARRRCQALRRRHRAPRRRRAHRARCPAGRRRPERLGKVDVARHRRRTFGSLRRHAEARLDGGHRIRRSALVGARPRCDRARARRRPVSRARLRGPRHCWNGSGSTRRRSTHR